MEIEFDGKLAREGLDEALRILEDTWRQIIGDPEIPLACAFCFTMHGDCTCEIPAFWPLPLVIYKLKAEIGSIEWN